MLAYVFWHWRREDVDAVSYAERLIAFHQKLELTAPAGFHASASFRSGPAPWLPGEETYEDWYLVDGSAALDSLNDAAVAGTCKAPHESAARSAQGGIAGLYRLRRGAVLLQKAQWAQWFSKPAGQSYEAFDAGTEATAESQAALWGRQMTLGPTPEFCLMSATPFALPAPIQRITRRLEAIWPSASPPRRPSNQA